MLKIVFRSSVWSFGVRVVKGGAGGNFELAKSFLPGGDVSRGVA